MFPGFNATQYKGTLSRACVTIRSEILGHAVQALTFLTVLAISGSPSPYAALVGLVDRR